MTAQIEHVAVLVVTYNSASLLPDLSTSLRRHLGSVPHSIVIVDNGSQDETVAVVRTIPNATLVETGHNGGYAAGINQGVAQADPAATAYLILNPDVRIHEHCVDHLLEALRQPGVGITVPRLEDRDGRLIYSMRREPSLRALVLESIMGSRRLARLRDIGETIYDDSRYSTLTTTDWAEGSTQLISRECMRACGPWDESFFLFSEETEFGLRARDRGFATIFVPTASATHLEGSRDDSSRSALVCRNRVTLYHRRHGLASSAAYYLGVVAGEAVRAAAGRASSRAVLRTFLSPDRMRVPPGPVWLTRD